MSYVIRSIVLIIALISGFANGGYQRNQAVPVEKVSYGEVVSVRQITTQELKEDQYSGWKTFGGALLGGLIGNQFGDGSGRDVATVLGALAGGGIARNRNPSNYYVQQQLIEMMIRLESDSSEVMVVQDLDRNMTFNAGNTVRLVFLQGGHVRVDKAM